LLFLLDDEGWPTLPVAEVLVESQAEAPFEPRMSSSICSLIIPVGATPTSLGELPIRSLISRGNGGKREVPTTNRQCEESECIKTAFEFLLLT
jgi:hypothetical protein